MKSFFTFSFLFLFGTLSIGQDSESVTIDYGTSYSKQVFYSFDDGVVNTWNNEAWDLAFTVEDGKYGIHVNEASTFMQESDHLFEILSVEFGDEPTDDILTDEIYNPDKSWNMGAFNVTSDSSDVDDFGWGSVVGNSDTLESVRFYALQLRTGDWKKIKISFGNGTYHLTYANFDNSDEQNFDIRKSDFEDSKLAYFSIENNKILPKMDHWDLFFGRYSAGIDVDGDLVPYTVLGVLTSGDVQVAEFFDVDQSSTVSDASEFEGLWENDIDVIGHDWKDFDLGAGGWVIHDNVVYYVKKESDVYKLVFSRFGGSSNGSMDFEETKLDIEVDNKDLLVNQFALNVFPNPIQDGQVIFGYELDNAQALSIQVVNNLGQIVYSGTQKGQTGFNVQSVSLSDVPNGFYTLILSSGNKSSYSRFMKAQ